MGRNLSSHTTPKVTHLLAAIARADTPVELYRSSMRDLGRELAKALQKTLLRDEARPLCVVCSVEDADFLGQGMLVGLEEGGVSSSQVRLVCFWNRQVLGFDGDEQDSLDLALITKQYKEVPDIAGRVVIAISSSLSSTRVMRTNLSTLLDSGFPARTIIAAPVMAAGVVEELRSRLGPRAPQLEHFAFALDDREGIPPAGASIFARLGLSEKLAIVPDLVKQRRRLLGT